jgi:hypothetical protein
MWRGLDSTLPQSDENRGDHHMRVLLSIIVVIGFTFLVILGALRVLADLLAMNTHRHPSFSDEFPEEDRESPHLQPQGESRSTIV